MSKDFLLIKEEIRDLIRNKDVSTLEIEAKFGIYKKTFYSGVIPFYFDRIKNYYPNLIFEKSKSYNIGGKRKIIYEDKTNYQEKKNLKHFNFPEYNIRISVNEEKIIDPFEEKNFNSIRLRDRYYYIFEDKFKIDITYVVDELKKEYKESYEVEIELLNFEFFDEFIDFIISNFKVLYQTELMYTNKEKELLNLEISEILNHENHMNFKYKVENKNFKKGPFIYKSCLVEPRNLTIKDITCKSLFDKTPYFLTFKADGLRKLLILHNTGLWLVYPPFEYNLLLRPSDNKIYNKLMRENIFIIDGELIKSTNSKYRFLAFDCLGKYYTRDNKKCTNLQDCNKIQFKNLEERMNCIQVLFINNIYQTNNLKITENIKNEIKNLRSLINVELKFGIKLNKENFFEQVQEMLNKEIDYNIDGLIFTPIKTEYNSFPQLNKKRTLDITPEVCKFKNLNELTIDLMVMKNQNNIELYAAKDYVGNESSEIIPLSKFSFFENLKIDHDNPITKDIRSGTIVEYYWDKTNKILNPKLIRSDKQAANRINVVLNNWEDLMDPITNDDICGKSLKLVFNYHKNLRNYLYDKIDMDTSILTIGTYDLKRIEKIGPVIISTKKNLENKNTIETKLSDVNFKNEFYKIHDKKVDNIIFLMSLYKFWKSKEELNNMCKNISNILSDNGKIIFMTLDGDLIENKFDLERKIKFSENTECVLYYNKSIIFGKKAKITLLNDKGKLKEKEGFLVHINSLTKRLEKFGIKLIEHNVANDELLSNFQKEYSSMYSYGYYAKQV